jgi:hypothetical protein
VKKKIQKLLGGALSATLVSSMLGTIPVRAEALSIDQIYANAYYETTKALSSKTQRSINTARAAIAQFPKDYTWAIGEFSKQIDSVQHPIFVMAYDAISKAQAYPTQANINFARACIDPDMPDYYKGSYSQALDAVQQKLMTNALSAYDKALKSKNEADITAANKLLAEIKGASDNSLADWAKSIETKLKESATVVAPPSSSTNSGSSQGDYVPYTPPTPPINYLNDGGTYTSNQTISSLGSGVFGASNRTAVMNGDLSINISNPTGPITLQNMNIGGTLYIDFGSGDVTLDNVTAANLVVTNVGSSSLHIKGSSSIHSLRVEDSNNDARIVVEENANILNTTVKSGAKLQASVSSENTNPFSVVNIEPEAKQAVVLAGTFEVVNVNRDSKLQLDSNSQVNNRINITAPVELSSTAAEDKIAKIDINTTNSSQKVVLSGDLSNVNINAEASIEIITGTVKLAVSPVLAQLSSPQINVTVNQSASVSAGNGLEKITVTGTVTQKASGTEAELIKTSYENLIIKQNTKVGELLENIVISAFATAKVVDGSKNPVSSDAVLTNTMQLEITAENGTNKRYYAITSVGIYMTTANYQREITANGEVIFIDLNDEVDRTVIIRGTSPKLIVNAPSANIVLNGARIGEVQIMDIAEHSLYLKDATVTTLNVADKNNNAHIVSIGNSTVESANINSGAEIESEASSETPFGNLIVNNQSSDPIKFKGNLGSASIDLQKASEVMVEGSINSIRVSENVTSVLVNKNSSINSLNIEATNDGILKVVDDASGIAALDKIVAIVGNLTANNNELQSFSGNNEEAIDLHKQDIFNQIMPRLQNFLGQDIDDTYAAQERDRQTHAILLEYQEKFLGLNQMNILSQKNQLQYVSSIRGLIRSANRQGVTLNYDALQSIIHQGYSIIRPIIESSKFKGHFSAETPIVQITAQQSNQEVDVTDQLIGFDNPLNSLTTYVLKGVGTIEFSPESEPVINNHEAFEVRNVNGAQRVFLKPSSVKDAINTDIWLLVSYMGDATFTSLKLRVVYPQDSVTMVTGYPRVYPGNPSSKMFFLSIMPNQDGKVYAAALPINSQAPTSQQLATGQYSNENISIATNVVRAGEESWSILPVGADNTDYDIYVVLEDTNGRLQNVPLKITSRSPQGSPSSNEITGIATMGLRSSYIKDNANNSYTLHVPEGTDVTKINLLVFISSGASVSPQSGSIVDLTSPITYAVRDTSGSLKNWIISCAADLPATADDIALREAQPIVVALFSDAARTALKEGVSQADIDAARLKVEAISDAELNKGSLIVAVNQAQSLFTNSQQPQAVTPEDGQNSVPTP